MLAALAAALAITGGIGCAGTVRSASRNAAQAGIPVVVDETLGSFEDVRNRERVEEILGTPEMQQAIRETSRAFVEGALQPGDTERVRALAAELTDTVSDALARDIRDKLVPAAAESMGVALRQADSSEVERELTGALRRAVGVATTAAITSASTEIPRTLAPAIRSAIVDSLDSPDMRAAVAGVTSEATRAALLSSRDVIMEMRETHGEAPLDRVIDRTKGILTGAIVGTFGVGALLGALVAWISRWRGPRGGSPSPSRPPEPPLAQLDRPATRAS